MKHFLGLVVLCVSIMATPAYAGTWVQREDATWIYEGDGGFSIGWQEIDEHWYCFNDEGLMLTGWIYDSEYDRWYYLDSQTGEWNSKPAVNEESAGYLLENALKAADLYQHEESELVFQVLENSSNEVQISVGREMGPNQVLAINVYTINKKSGIAKPTVGNNLYIYE